MNRFAISLLLVCLACAAHQFPSSAQKFPPSAIIPFNGYPHYMQCDPLWGNDVIENQTICDVGCLLTSTSMGLAGHGIKVPNQNNSTQPATPGSVNRFLKNHHGYSQQNDMREIAISWINPSDIRWVGKYIPQTKCPIVELQEWLNWQTRVVIANVLNGTHFVLVVGYDSIQSDLFYVYDPAFNTTSYSYDGIVGWRIFDMWGIN